MPNAAAYAFCLIRTSIVAALLLPVGCGGERSHPITYDQFRALKPGAAQASVERAFGPPASIGRAGQNGREKCLGWERVGARVVPDKPAFIACFLNSRLYSTSILDPAASD